MLQLGGNGGMGMLKSITLENYKCFRDVTTIDIAPLTVFCGVNSSGKSSILKSLLMMKQTVEKESPYNKLAFIGNYVDNGYFNDIINVAGAKTGSFLISNTFSLSEYSNQEKKRQDMQSYKEIKKLYSALDYSCDIGRFEITHTVKINESDKKGILYYIDNNNVIETTITIKVFNKSGDYIPDLNGTISIKKCENDKNGREYTLDYSNIPLQNNIVSIPIEESKKRFVCYFNNIKLTNLYQDNISAEIVNIKPTILTFFNVTSMQYSGLLFIAPLRQFPSRNYIITGDINSVGNFGEYSPIFYTKSKDERCNYDIPTPFQENGCCKLNFNSHKVRLYKTFSTQFQLWFDYFDLGQIETLGDGGTLSLLSSGHNLADVGFGVSQVLPIIIQGLCMTKDETMLLEQPEIHLHPKMQMNMADFLLAVASTQRNMIVETHSDHIINRIVRRVMETYGTKNDLSEIVKIYFVYKDENNCTQIYRDIKIDPNKGLTNCPPEFFDQYGDELRVIMKQGYENFKKQGE